MNNQNHDPQTFENRVISENTSSLDDAFNPERLRLSQNFENLIGVKKVLTAVPVRNPDRQSFIRVHPSPTYRIETAVLELKAERETYLVEPSLIPDLPGEVIPKVLFTAVTRQGVVFIWPIRLPDAEGRHNSWSDTALQGATAAMENWVRIASNMNLGGYELYIASAALPEPEWPDLNFRELLKIAFKDKFIRSLARPSSSPEAAGTQVMQFGDIEFSEVWGVDFEFVQPVGSHPEPVCMVANEFTSGRTIRLFKDQLRCCGNEPPYSVSPHSLFLSYYSIAELSCHLALDWPLPARVLDLYAEFRNLTNGLETPAGNSLLGALAWFGLDLMDAVEKDTMRQLAMRGGPWNAEERTALLEYCERDVIALRKLFERMCPKLDIKRALLRGRYMKAVAKMEHIGIPIDTVSLATLRENWESIQDRLIARVDRDYGVFDRRRFKTDRFAEYLVKNGIPWPRLPSGNLALDEDTFRIMESLCPQIAPLRQLRATLSQMRLSELAVGADSRNRCRLSPFRARTGRNQPSNTEFIFGPSVWLRGLIYPAPGYGVAYVDWSQQEFGIAAALSRDEAMMRAHMSGDPYLEFAKQALAVPADATKRSHSAIRNQFKSCALAVQYGMGAEALAVRIAQPVSQARDLLRLHLETYRQFWKWSDASVDFAMLYGHLTTVFGWTIHVGSHVNPRSLRNYPMPANGAEMLRLACCLATERGVRVCAPIHDAILIEAAEDELEHAIEEAQRAMSDASALVLDGFRLHSDARPIIHPARYEDERGKRMWETCWQVIRELQMKDQVEEEEPAMCET